MRYGNEQLQFESHDLVCVLKHKDTNRYHICILYNPTLKNQVRFEVDETSFSAGFLDTNQLIEALKLFYKKHRVGIQHFIPTVYAWNGKPFIVIAEDWVKSEKEVELLSFSEDFQKISEIIDYKTFFEGKNE